VAVNQTIGVVQGATRTVTLAANDPETHGVTFTIVSGPAHGALGTLSGNQINYIAPVSYHGPDSFTYRAIDSQGAVGPIATVSVNVISRLVVTTTADAVVNDEFVSLREAISYANAVAGADTITFDIPSAGPHVINLASSLTINTDMTINGPADEAVTVRCPRTDDASFVIFEIPGGTVLLSRLSIVNGFGSQAGGINNAGTLTLSECTVSGSQGNGIRNRGTLLVRDSTLTDNRAEFGAAIHNTGKLDVVRSSLSNNTAEGGGGAIITFGSQPVTITDTTFDNNVASGAASGALDNWSTTTLRNCTFNNNRSPAFEGGAVSNYTNGILSVTNCTFTGNLSKNRGGAIYNSSAGILTLKSSTLTGNIVSDTSQSRSGGAGLYDLGTLTIQNTVIAGNTAANRGDVIAKDSATSLGYNFIGKWESSTVFTGTGDQFGTIAAPLDAKLDTLKNNGGFTRTIAPLPNSPLIDKGKRSSDSAGNLINVDQRGSVRPVELGGIANAASGDGSDIGAVELPATLFPTVNDQSASTAEDTAKVITLVGSAPDDSTLTYEIVSQPAHGTLSAVSGNQVTYTPAANYHGNDAFAFRAITSGGAPSSNIATVTITVTPAPTRRWQ
jgi:CSLREA domain-containing protein